MSCFPIRSPFCKRLEYLLGPVNGISQPELKLYKLAALTQVGGKNNTKFEGCSFEVYNGIDKQDPKLLPESVKVSTSQKQTDDTLEKTVHYMEIHGSNSAMATAQICDFHLFIPCTATRPEIFCQNYRKWKAGMDLSFRLHQCRKKRKIYILPIDNFPDFIMNAGEDPSQSSFFKVLKQFAEIYFLGFEIEILPVLNSVRAGWQIRMRKHHVTGQSQQLVTDFYPYLRQMLPKDGYCILGISWTDLYPSEKLNFVLGEASTRYSSAMFCFGRYEPKAYSGDDAVKEINGDLFWKLFRVMSHETCHLFGIEHCVFFSCSMNESKSLAEALSQPLLLCPVCLRKMQKVCRFDLLQRYGLMLEFLPGLIRHDNEDIKQTIAWLERAVRYCSTNQ